MEIAENMVSFFTLGLLKSPVLCIITLALQLFATQAL